MTSTQSDVLARSFASAFGGTVVTRDDQWYDSARAVWNAMADGHPALIARCHSAEDIAAAVSITREAGLPLAVRAGGHSVAGLSTCDGGVVIALSPMRAVSIDPARRTAAVQPGATWADFDAAGAVLVVDCMLGAGFAAAAALELPTAVLVHGLDSEFAHGWGDQMMHTSVVDLLAPAGQVLALTPPGFD